MTDAEKKRRALGSSLCLHPSVDVNDSTWGHRQWIYRTEQIVRPTVQQSKTFVDVFCACCGLLGRRQLAVPWKDLKVYRNIL